VVRNGYSYILLVYFFLSPDGNISGKEYSRIKKMKRISEEDSMVTYDNNLNEKPPKRSKESPYDEVFQKNFFKWQGTEARKKYFFNCMLCQKEIRSDKRKKHLNTTHPEYVINHPELAM